MCLMQYSFANQHDAPSFWFCCQVTEVITRITFPSILQEQINQRSLLFFSCELSLFYIYTILQNRHTDLLAKAEVVPTYY